MEKNTLRQCNCWRLKHMYTWLSQLHEKMRWKRKSNRQSSHRIKRFARSMFHNVLKRVSERCNSWWEWDHSEELPSGVFLESLMTEAKRNETEHVSACCCKYFIGRRTGVRLWRWYLWSSFRIALQNLVALFPQNLRSISYRQRFLIILLARWLLIRFSCVRWH